MIDMIRLDERLIHGQVATKWSRLMQLDRIVVADDDAAANELTQKTLMMAAPAGLKVAIVTVDRAIALCTDPRAENLHILAIVSNPNALLRMVEEVPGIKKVNIGNYGRIVARRDGAARPMYDKNLYAYPDEIETLRKVAASGIPCSIQVIPDDQAKDLLKVIGS